MQPNRRSSWNDSDIVAPRLYIMSGAWKRILAYVQSNALGYNEINGFGYITITPDGNFVLDTAFITKQTVTPGTAESSGYESARALDRADQDGRGDDLRLQWHSHVNGDAYHSSTDMNTVRSYGTAGMEWYLTMVTNVRGERDVKLSLYRPFGLPFDVIVPLESSIVETFDPALQAEVDEEVARLVTVERLLPPAQPRGSRSIRRVSSTKS